MPIAAITTTVYLLIIFLLVAVVVYLLWGRRQSSIGEQAGEELEGDNNALACVSSASLTGVADEQLEQLLSFSHAMSQCPSTIIITDLDGVIEYVNPRFCEVSGYRSDEAVGRNPRFLKSGNIDPGIYEDLWSTISRGLVWRGELENRRKDGRLFWELVSISPIKDKEGNLLRYLAVKEDINEAKEQEQEAKRARMEAEVAEAAEQAKAVFLKVIGNEMKDPLNRVLGFTNLLSQSELDNDQLKHLNQVGAAGLELLGLIDRILDFTSAETGTMELESRPFKPAEVVSHVLQEYEQKAAVRNIVIQREIPESIPDYVIGDEKRFRQVLEPLLENAVQYTYEGTIIVRLSAQFLEGTQVWSFKGEVEDTGKGIPEEKLQVLFRPFTQMEPGSKGGAGLGLALCQRLCQLQGGELAGRSRVGAGSTFTFKVNLKPMDMDHAALRLAKGPEGEQFARAYPIDILVAEDNRINRRLLETLMERLGYQASFTVDGIGVLAEVKKRHYDLILMDLQMPNLNGIDAARRIRAGEVGPEMRNTRIVAITAFTTDENLEASREVGMDAFLAKPFDISKIKLEIINAYESKKLREKGDSVPGRALQSKGYDGKTNE